MNLRRINIVLISIIIFVLGLRQNKTQIRHLGSATIAIVVGKLFLVDLAELETIWRIILFLTFGGLLLFVSYFLEKLIKPSKDKEKAEFINKAIRKLTGI